MCIMEVEAADVRCDIVRNHCCWCKCQTPILHTYIITRHKCDDYCDTSISDFNDRCLRENVMTRPNRKSNRDPQNLNLEGFGNISTNINVSTAQCDNNNVEMHSQSDSKLGVKFSNERYIPMLSRVKNEISINQETFFENDKTNEEMYCSLSENVAKDIKLTNKISEQNALYQILRHVMPYKNGASVDSHGRQIEKKCGEELDYMTFSRTQISSETPFSKANPSIEHHVGSNISRDDITLPDNDQTKSHHNIVKLKNTYTKNYTPSEESLKVSPFPSTEQPAEGSMAENGYRCQLCLTESDSFEALSNHLEQHHEDKLYICCFCQKIFSDITSLKRHIRMHTGERPYKCKECGKKFSIPGNFKKHRDTHNKLRNHKCPVCDKTFARKEHLKYHSQVHTGEKPFKCSKCDACYAARYCLKIHMNIHLGLKPYKCNYCDKCFSDKSTMRKHIRIHTGEKPYECTVCKKRFKDSSALNTHRHIHEEVRRYTCSFCSLTFKTKSGAYQHEKIHTQEKHLVCKYCGVYFRYKYNMEAHERIHTGEKPYTCFYCKKSFRTRSCLLKHIVIHAGEDGKKFKCELCEKSFFRNAHLTRHKKTHREQQKCQNVLGCTE